MSITLKEIVTIEEYLSLQPQDSGVEEDLIQSAINRAIITLDAICGGMIEKVWDVEDETSTYYRTEAEHNYIKQAHIIQAQYYISRNLDLSAGSENYSSGSNNYGETRPKADLVADEIIYQLLAKGRVYNPNITSEMTITGQNATLGDFYDPTYDAGNNYVTYNVGDNRYILKNNTTGTEKFLYNNSDGNIEYVDIKLSTTGTSSATANFMTINGVEWALGASAGGAIWGNITGTITDQTDLVSYITTRLADYATQEWVNQQGFLKEHQSLENYYTKEQTSTLLDNKVDKITTSGYGAYGHNGSTQQEWTIDANPTAQTLAYRTTNGVLRVGTPTEDNNATTKLYVDNALSKKQDTISKYANDATVSDNTLTINFSNGDTTSFTPTSSTGGITDVQVTDTSGTASVVTSGVATIDLTGYATTEDLNSKTQKLVETTYSELVTLRDNSQLVAGCWYRITDYVATTTQSNTQATTNQYDIIVLATSTNTLSEEARAIQHSEDTYFASSNLNKWKVWYSLDNDSTRYAWADTTNGKGIVYRLIDEFDNDVWYDFKCIKVTNDNAPESGSYYYLFDNSGVDASLNTSSYITCYSNHFGNYVTSNYNIGCNICYGGKNFYNNIIGNGFDNNTIGNNFYSNIIGNYFYINTIGNDFNSNTLGNNFCLNTIGNDFKYNIVGYLFASNTTTYLTSQPQYCVFPSYVYKKIISSAVSLTDKRTYYLSSDGSLKSLS